MADYDFVRTSDNAVMVTSGKVARFAKSWPCSGMRFDRDIAVQFGYAANGDLVDIQWFDCSDDSVAIDIAEPGGVNDEALNALSQDALQFLREEKLYEELQPIRAEQILWNACQHIDVFARGNWTPTVGDREAIEILRKARRSL